MPITREKKGKILASMKEAVKGAKSIVFVNFHGLNVGETTELRKNLRNEGVSYGVAKKTLIKIALKDLSVEGEQPPFDGELAIAYGEDMLAPAREVFEFQKKHEGQIAILGGIFEGKYMNQAEMMEIATIPPRQVLLGQFVNLINSPIQGLVIALDGIAEKKTA